MLIEQIFTKRVIKFPEELWQNKCSNPNVERLLLGITAAAMLFPRDYESFSGYIAKELGVQAGLAERRLYDERLSAFCEQQTLKDSDHSKGHAVHLQDVTREISEGSLLPEREDQIDLAQAKFQRMYFGSPAVFQKHCGWRGFSEKGKGSLAERMLQGRICGQICLSMALAEKTLSESIRYSIPFLEKWRNESDEIRDAMPTLSFANIQNTIWPNFKDVAWLWSSLSVECPVHDGQRLSLYDTSFRSPEYILLLNALEVHRGGWWGFMDFAVKVFELLQKQGKGYFEQKNSRPWRFSFQLSENELELL